MHFFAQKRLHKKIPFRFSIDQESMSFMNALALAIKKSIYANLLIGLQWEW